MPNKNKIAYELLNKTFKDSSQWSVEKLSNNKERKIISFLNAHAINNAYNSQAFANSLLHSNILLRDGIGIEIGLKIFGFGKTENLNGTDLIPKILSQYKDQKISIYGTSDDTLLILKDTLKQQGFNNIISTLHGFLSDQNYLDDAIKYHPDVIILCMGMPKQEILSLKLTKHAPLIICGGGWADFHSKQKKRAPLWAQKIRAEWIYRLLKEPRRLGKRYTIDILYFFYILLKTKILFKLK